MDEQDRIKIIDFGLAHQVIPNEDMTVAKGSEPYFDDQGQWNTL